MNNCVICRKPYSGRGNNPRPVKYRGRCCDDCNVAVVLPRRIGIINYEQHAQRVIEKINSEDSTREQVQGVWGGDYDSLPQGYKNLMTKEQDDRIQKFFDVHIYKGQEKISMNEIIERIQAIDLTKLTTFERFHLDRFIESIPTW